ncbi:MAG: Flp pilus assembly protein CpaB [Gammaproteobacteria bacterium]
MNSRFLIMLIIALVLAGGAAFIAKRWAESLNTQSTETAKQDSVPVYVAAVDIPFATRIEQTHYKLIPWPKGNVPAEAFTQDDTNADPNALVGKVTQREFYAGEILLKPQIKEHLGGSTLSALIQEGMRAMSVRVNDVVGVAGFILPGNRADIIASRGGVTYTLLKNIKVLAIDQVASKRDEPTVVKALTLEVTPKQAEILVQAMQQGSLQFTLRNPTDSEGVIIETAESRTGTAPKKVVKQITAAPEVTISILPWQSQTFIKCKDDGTC